MKIDDRLLTQAFMNNNRQFVESLPTDVKPHNFSKGFEKKMNHVIVANKKYGGNLWAEKVVRYSAKAAVIILCLLTINFVSVKAFDLNIWNVIVTKTSEFLNIHFEKSGDDVTEMENVRWRVSRVPDGYEQQEDYRTDHMSVQHFISENGTITYTESLISETADIHMEAGISGSEQVGLWKVNYIIGDNSITAFFTDETYYHIVEIQGADANEEFASKIIEELEAQ